MDIVELNERCRFLLYLPGQKFPAHKDGCYVRPSGKGNEINKKGNKCSLYLYQDTIIRPLFFWFNLFCI